MVFIYTQASSRCHERSGHLFQGRFKGILVGKDAYLLELGRYVVLNPVRAGMVASAEDWLWSICRAMLGDAPVPNWLAVDGLLSQFSWVREEARDRYRRFVLEGVGQRLWGNLRQQIFFGDEAPFVALMQAQARIEGDALSVPLAQRRTPAPSLEYFASSNEERNAAIVAEYASGAYSYRQIAAYFGIHLATIECIVRADVQ